MKFSEGLEVLGTDEYLDDGKIRCGVFEATSVSSVELPSTLRRIEYNAFAATDELQSIKFPDSLEYIGDRCFLGSGLLKVQIPRVGIKVGDSAFNNCPAKSGLVFRGDRVFQKDQ